MSRFALNPVCDNMRNKQIFEYKMLKFANIWLFIHYFYIQKLISIMLDFCFEEVVVVVVDDNNNNNINNNNNRCIVSTYMYHGLDNKKVVLVHSEYM